MMKLSFSAAALRDFDAVQAVHLVGQSGYDGVELELNDVHLHPMKSSRQEVLAVRGHCEMLGLAIPAVATTGPDLTGVMPYGASLITGSRLGRQRRLEVIRRSVFLAQTLESPVLVINSGPPDPQVSRAQARDYLLQALVTLKPMLGEMVLALEPEPGYFVGTTEEAVDLLKELEQDHVRLCLNIAHLFSGGGGGYAVIAGALPYTRHIHVSDTAMDAHRHLIPGEGDINFMRVDGIVGRADYHGFASVELSTQKGLWQRALDASRNYLALLSPESVSA